MSCLPDLFIPTKSQRLAPLNKVGGVFSVNLRSSYFSSLRKSGSLGETNSNDKALSFSLQSKRYTSFTNRPQSRRTSKSFYNKKSTPQERGLQQNGYTNENLNGKLSNHSEIQAISSFNILKRNAYQTLHLCNKTLQFTSDEVKTMKSQLTAFNQSIQTELQTITQQLTQKCQTLTRQFRGQRREMISQTKTINQQITYIKQQLLAARQINKQLHNRQSKILNQFI